MNAPPKSKMKILSRCQICGEATAALVDFPTFDGSGILVERKVKCACRCVQEKNDAFRRRMKREAEERELSQFRSLSLLADNRECCNAHFSTYQVDDTNRKQYGIAERYVQNWDKMLSQGQGLVFYGGVGTGKSYTAATIANELLDRGVSVVMTSFPKLIDEIQKELFENHQTQYLDRLNAAKLLIIDDLGAERGTDYSLEKVYTIVDSRYRDRKPAIFTTNLTLKQMNDSSDIRYARVYDRILEMCFPVKFSGLSKRKCNVSRRHEAAKKLLEG